MRICWLCGEAIKTKFMNTRRFDHKKVRLHKDLNECKYYMGKMRSKNKHLMDIISYEKFRNKQKK